jgi:hypothetical protein
LETVGLRVPNPNLGDFNLLLVDLKLRNCPSATRVSAANAVSKDTGILDGRYVFITDLLRVAIFTF